MDEEAHVKTPSRPFQLLQWMNPFSGRRQVAIPEERETCPEYKAGFFSLLTFSWMSPLMAVSNGAHLRATYTL